MFLYILHQDSRCVLFLCVRSCSVFLLLLPEHLEFHEGDGQGKDVGVHRPQAVDNRGCRRDHCAEGGKKKKKTSSRSFLFCWFFFNRIYLFLNWPPAFLLLTNPLVRSRDLKRRGQQPGLAGKQEMLIARPIRRFLHRRQSRRPALCATCAAVQPLAAAFATHFKSPLPQHVRDYNALCLAVFSLTSTTTECWSED